MPMMPNEGEKESEFMGRCIKHHVDNGKEQDQAVAICANIWGDKAKADKDAAKDKAFQVFDDAVRGKACSEKTKK